MPWAQLAMFVVSFLIVAFLAPKPRVENARAQSLDDLRFPQASEGTPVTLVLGRVRVAAPNTLWYGDFEAVAIRKKVKTGVFSSKRITVGYRYYVGFDAGICLGSGVRLRKVWIGKKEVWSGDIGPGEAEFTIDKPGLFGGDQQGGGFVSTCRFYGGSFAQSRNAYLQSKAHPDVPAYNGVAHVVFEQAYVGESAQLRPIRYEVCRYTNSLGLNSTVQFIGEDLNPMEVLYQVLVSRWGGLDVDAGDIDAPSFVAAAQTLADEGNGMSLIVSKSNGGKSTIEEILRQIDGILYQEPETGKIVVRLVRYDYDVETLPLLTPANVISVRNFSRTSWEDTLNQVRVTYPRRDNKYETGAAMVQDMANINAQGRLRSTNSSFPGCHTPELAVSLATRELSMLSIPMYKVTIEVNREVAQLRPGEPFRFSWPEYGIEDIVMRVQRFNLGELVDGRIVIEAIQDRFAANDTVFAAPEKSLYEPITRDAEDVTQAVLTEAPNWLLRQQEDVPLPGSGNGYPLLLPRNVNAFQLAYSAKIGDVSIVDYTAYDGSALLDTAIAKLDGFTTGTTSLNIRDVRPNTDWLAGASTAETRTGVNLLVIGEEWLTYESVTDNGNGTWTLGTVHRGLLDTQPVDHAELEPVFLAHVEGLSLEEFSATSDFTVKVMSYTDSEATPEAGAPTFTHTPDRRYERPLPPDWTVVNGSRSPGTITTQGPHSVDWRARNRNSDLIAFPDDSAETEEQGVTYTLRVYLDDVLQSSLTESGITNPGTNVTFASPSSGTARIEIASERDGLESYTRDWIEFQVNIA